MALNFQGDRAVGVLNDTKNTFNTGDLVRVYDGGILVPGGVAVDHGDFVSWDGTKWVKEANIKIARSDEITNTNSSIAPDYTKKTYTPNSYVMHDGVLYTNPSAISFAEDWNPNHWTPTTVSAAVASWTYTNKTESISGGQTKNVTVDNRVLVNLTATRRAPLTNPAVLKLYLNGECIVNLNKTTGVRVMTYIGSGTSTPTTNISTGSTVISLDDSDVAVKAVLHYYAGHLIIAPVA